MENIAILGCGNMGGAIAHGLAKNGSRHLFVTSKNGLRARELASAYPNVTDAASNYEAVRQCHTVIIAVKPWLVKDVLSETESLLAGKNVLSVAAGVRDSRIQVYAMPNIAAEFAKSMTFIENSNLTEAQQAALDIFGAIGKVMVINTQQMQAGMMLAGCGIAYVMRMVRAMSQAGCELGFRPDEAKGIAIQTMEGAATLLQETGLHPEVAIDKVTTPGGFTVKGLNELDHAGFTSAIIRAIKAGLT